MSARQPPRPCTCCGVMTRSNRTTAADAPGTIVRGSTDLCMNCWTREHKKLPMKPVTTSSAGRVPCSRCGVERVTDGKDRPLCRDCLSVLTKKEQEAWAA